MMSQYIAHSEKNEFPAQTYKDHVMGVYNRAKKYSDEVELYSAKSSDNMKGIVKNSALLHDLGKLDDKNQSVLNSSSSGRSHLPINHVDAGSCVLKSRKDFYSALMVYSHHRGLPNMCSELIRNEESIFRDEHKETREYVENTVEELLNRHNEMIEEKISVGEVTYEGDLAVFFRMILSCLADADHIDTAAAYGHTEFEKDSPPLRAEERLASLDQYVSRLTSDDIRSQLRQEMYISCRDMKTEERFSVCDSPVGSGKTTAVMAHLLQQAIDRKSRRIFVILPYTSIIQQSVEVYREALVLPGENPEEVVAEIHSRVDFQDSSTRYLTSLWRAPIVVTTAVSFFETLASNRPATLRRLHEIPGSLLFIDEAHSVLPLKLLPIAWKWMNVLAEEWNCYWVLASGSLIRFWGLDSLAEFNLPKPNISELIECDLYNKLVQYEHNRITFRWKAESLSRSELVEWIHQNEGPRLLILNTIQNAAVIAEDICTIYGRECVEHLSTALKPEDRNATIERIKKRLKDKSDTNWTLVATSCVEAGMDFSFRTGFRELSSLRSLLQSAGRVNRHGLFENAIMWSFYLKDDSMLVKNAALADSCRVLRGYFENNLEINPELSTKSMNDEIIQNDSCKTIIKKFIDLEEAMQFKDVNSEFKVIDSDMVLAVVDEDLVEKIVFGKGDWVLLQKKSVSIRTAKIKDWNLKEIAKGVYQWTLRYDSFLGYMRGVLDMEKLRNDTLFC